MRLVGIVADVVQCALTDSQQVGAQMGDRLERSRLLPPRLKLELGLRPPHEMLAWGLAAPIGHNNGPPLDGQPNDAFVAWRWRKAHRQAWKNPPLSILKFRVARAEAAGVTYREYTLQLLDTGRHLQAAGPERPREAGHRPSNGPRKAAQDD